MTNRRLIFCRTPLQAMVAGAVQQAEPACDTIVYQPTSQSPKHRTYFDHMAGDRKIFIDWMSDHPSHLLKELRTYFAIPWRVRHQQYDEYYVSSYDSLVFALLTAGRSRAQMRTFDDGVMSLLPSELEFRLEHEPKLHRIIKTLVCARNTRQLLAAADRHYTIYDCSAVVFDQTKLRSISLPRLVRSDATMMPLTILLGTPIALFRGDTTQKILDQYHAVKHELAYDIFIPHPAEALQGWVADCVPDAENLRVAIETYIAEDVIWELYERGHDLTVYGIASSALVNVRSFAKTINIIIPDVNQAEREIFDRLGVDGVEVHDLIGLARS